jgi:hypothetical protein
MQLLGIQAKLSKELNVQMCDASVAQKSYHCP